MPAQGRRQMSDGKEDFLQTRLPGSPSAERPGGFRPTPMPDLGGK